MYHTEIQNIGATEHYEPLLLKMINLRKGQVPWTADSI